MCQYMSYSVVWVYCISKTSESDLIRIFCLDTHRSLVLDGLVDARLDDRPVCLLTPG